MLSQQQIIKTIRSIHRRREPLNITAVKRRHPELIQAVYAVKPFWGWKTALKDAWINYGGIKIELLEYIDCELCNKSVRNLANHLILKHGVWPDKYLMDYPESDLICEVRRANQLQKAKVPVPHWEPLWSREYVLDRADEYHRRGYPMHYSKFTDIDNSLVLAAINHAGGWNNVLIAIGIDPHKATQEAYRQLRNYPDKKAVINGIRQRLKKGLLLFVNAIRTKRGNRKSDAGLYASGIEYFGTWDNALKEAGVGPDVLRQLLRGKRKYKSPEDIICEIHAREKRKWSINHGAIYHGKYPDRTLGWMARKFFGSWKEALRAAGFDPTEVYWRRRKYPDKDTVLQAMKNRIKHGHHLNRNSVWSGRQRDSALVNSAVKCFGAWNDALKAAGLDPLQVRHDARLRGAERPRKGRQGSHPEKGKRGQSGMALR